jgi:hypothetical protein
MQQPSGAPPTTPTPPAPVLAGGGGTNVYTVNVPQTPQDLAALRERRSELSNQLESAASRRAEIVEEMQTAEGAVKAGLEQRMSVLDQRILQLENDIAATGRELTSAPAGLIAASQDPFTEIGIPPHLIEKVSILFTLFVLAPLAIGAAYLMFKRAGRAPAPQVRSADGGERMQRLESAVDAIAVEIERISEGQRFVTKLLTESAPQGALGARQAERARIGSRSESE